MIREDDVAHAGQVLVNPVSGERVVFAATAADTGGASLRWEHGLRPGARIPAHYHPHQTERFEVLEGTVTIRVGSRTQPYGPGAVVTVARAETHALRNHSAGDVRLGCLLEPALRTEDYFEAVFTLAAEGKVWRNGLPNPLRTALILDRCPDTAYVTVVPQAVQRAAIRLLAAAARLAGYR